MQKINNTERRITVILVTRLLSEILQFENNRQLVHFYYVLRITQYIDEIESVSKQL